MLNLPAFYNLPRALALDLDGTLFNSRLEISERTRRALDSCLDRGFPVILATSRPERSVVRYCGLPLVERCSLVLSNGSVSRGVAPLAGGGVKSISATLARAVVDCIVEIEPAVTIAVEITGFEFGMNQRPSLEILWQRNSAGPEMLLSLEEALARNPCKIAVGGLSRNLDLLRGVLVERFAEHLRVFPSDQGTFLNIVDRAVSKSTAVTGLLAHYGLTLADLLVCGDDLPDLDLLAGCGFPVSMGNAEAAVKAVCRYQTLSNDQDGVAVVLEKLLSAT